MKKPHVSLFVVGMGVALAGMRGGVLPRVEAGVGSALPPCEDLNGDGSGDVSDAIFFLSWRFLGGPAPTCPTPGGEPRSLPATGLAKCFDASGAEILCDSATCPGQDGHQATGEPAEGRYFDNGDDTVTDNSTGLMWQKQPADLNGDGQSSSADSVDWCGALTYCEALSFAGHHDWRLPNLRELRSIVDYGRFDPSIAPVFGASTDYRELGYWSSTSHPRSPSRAWGVHFGNGAANGGIIKVEPLFVRAVRGGGSLLSPCQDPNGDGSSDVSDVIFFLSWRFLGGPAPSCPAAGSKLLGLPDTGQERCFDAAGAEIPCASATCPGQDGRHATGCPQESRFTDNGDGTVTDNCTRLQWQKDTADLNGDGQATEEDSADWCSALTHCEDLSLAGHDDWRLPNVQELLSLADHGRVDQAIDAVFGLPENTRIVGYWSSTSLLEFPDKAWIVSHEIGFDSTGVGKIAGLELFVRAVRSAP